jgi:hypothetical protein
MKLTDSRGLQVSTTSLAALEMHELAVDQALGYFGNPLETLDEALGEDADFAAAHALRADLAVMSSERGALPLIRQSLEAFERIGNRANARERAHVAAARAWLEGDFARSAQLYGAIAIEHPRDLVALPRTSSTSTSATRPCCAITSPRPCRTGTTMSPAMATCSACMPSASRRPATTHAPRTSAATRSR